MNKKKVKQMMLKLDFAKNVSNYTKKEKNIQLFIKSFNEQEIGYINGLTDLNPGIHIGI